MELNFLPRFWGLTSRFLMRPWPPPTETPQFMLAARRALPQVSQLTGEPR